jgi:hypothetical protein
MASESRATKKTAKQKDTRKSPVKKTAGRSRKKADGEAQAAVTRESEIAAVNEAPRLREVHELVERLDTAAREQWRELQEATRSLDELCSRTPRRSDVVDGQTQLHEDVRELIEPLVRDAQHLRERLQWTLWLLIGLAALALPAFVKVLVS